MFPRHVSHVDTFIVLSIYSVCSVWFKYRDSKFYNCVTHAFACTLTSIPMALIDTAVYSMIVYFMNGFYYSAGAHPALLN